MSYNLTTIDAATDAIDYMAAANDLTGGVLANGISLVLAIIIFSLTLEFTNDYRKALIGSGAISFIMGIVMFAMGLINVYLIVLYLVLMVVGIILMRDKDTGV